MPPASFSALRAATYGAGSFGAGTVFAFANAVLPLYLAGYGLPNWAIGLLAQDRPPLAGASQLVVGALSDRTQTALGRRRPYILLGAPITTAALLGLAWHPPVVAMVLLLVVMTTALAVAYGPYLALLADLVPERRRGIVGGVLQLASMLGQLGILFLAAQLWEQHPWAIFGAVAAALGLGFALTFVGVGEGSSRLAGAPEGKPAIRALRFRPGPYVRGLLAHREVAKYLLATVFFWLGTGAVVPFLTRFGVEELGTDEATAFRLFMVAIAATALATLPAGWLGDQLGKQRVLLGGLAAFGLAVVISSQVRTVEQAIVALAITGIANGVCSALLFPLLVDLVPRHRAGELTGLGSAVWELVQPLAAALGGLAADASGTLRSTLVAAGLALLVASFLLRRVRTASYAAPADAPHSGSASPNRPRAAS